MDWDGTKTISKPQRLRPHPPNRIIPETIDFETEEVREDGPMIGEAPIFNELEETKREVQSPHEKGTLLAVTKNPMKTIEGEAQQFIFKDIRNEDAKKACFIELRDQKLYLHGGGSEEGKIIHEFEFPHGVEYRFIENSDEKRLIITDKKGQQIRLIIKENQLYQDLLTAWYSTKLFSDFLQKLDQDVPGEYKIKDYGLTFNPPSFREFGNVYNDNSMETYEYIQYIDGKPQIKNAVDFNHKYRPSRKMTKSQYEVMMNGEKTITDKEKDEEIDKHMKEREFLLLVPSRDWSRLFMLSYRKDIHGINALYLEFYDFDSQDDFILHPNRINHISQLMRPQWIQFIDNFDCNIKDSIMASFIADNEFAVVLKDNSFEYAFSFFIFKFQRDWKIEQKIPLGLTNEDFERLKRSTYDPRDKKPFTDRFIDVIRIEKIQSLNSRMILKSDDVYYQFNDDIMSFTNRVTREMESHPSAILVSSKSETIRVQLDQDFIKDRSILNIINCGIYDIVIYDKHVKISNIVSPLNELHELQVDDVSLSMLKSQNFIQLYDHSIACLWDDRKQIQIIDFTLDYLIKRDRDQLIELKPPQDDWDFQDCKFDLIKLKENQYAEIIVSLKSQQTGFFYQLYMNKDGVFQFELEKQLGDYISLQQIPHLPFVIFNGSLKIDHDIIHKKYQIGQNEKLNQGQYDIESEELQVYDSRFKKYLFEFIALQNNTLTLSQCNEFEKHFDQIEISEFQTFVSISKQPEGDENLANFSIFIFCPPLNSIKSMHFDSNVKVRYVTHKVINHDSRNYLSIILLINKKSLKELRIIFKDCKVLLQPLTFINEEDQDEEIFGDYRYHEQIFRNSYYSDDSTLSLIFYVKERVISNAIFCQFQSNFKDQQQQINWIMKLIIRFDPRNPTAQQMQQITQSLNLNESLKIKDSILEEFKEIITQNNSQFDIEQYKNAYIIRIKNNFILYEPGNENITILDKRFSVICKVTLKYGPLLKIMFNSLNQDPGALEYIDAFYYRFPIPILFPDHKRSQFDKNQKIILHQYYDDLIYPMRFQFGLHEGFISHFDQKSEKLNFYLSKQDWKDKQVSARIELSQQIDSIIDKLSKIEGRKKIEQVINEQHLNDLLSFNINTRINLISGTKYLSNRGLIYSALQKRLEAADVKELPILFYNISSDLRQNKNMLDVLIENSAFKLLQLIVSIAIKQDQFGLIYNKLSQYLFYFSSNEIHMYLDSPIFFFKISKDFYEEYQSQDISFIKPYSNYDSLAEVQTNIKTIENEIILKIKAKNLLYYLKSCFFGPETLEVKSPVEYYAINLMELNEKGSEMQIQRQPSLILMQEAEKDATILEKESVQIIIDFKWKLYAQKFFTLQLMLFICFIVAFIIDIVAVSKNSQIFESNDSNQVIPRIMSLAIMILFAVYELLIMIKNKMEYIKSYWNLIDQLFILFYTAYFIMSFYKPDNEYALKTLQLVIVFLSFLKVSFLIRVWKQVSFLVKMLSVVFLELRIFLFYFLVVISTLTVMAQIIINQPGDGYKGVSEAANFLIVLRQASGDTDTSSIIDGTRDYKILAWLLWFVILIVGIVVFMNFIIAVVSESYENCMEKKIQIIYIIKLEMIAEFESVMPDWLFTREDWFPKFIIIRRMLGNDSADQDPDEWQGFVRQINRNLEKQTAYQNEFIQRSTDNSKREQTAEIKKELAEMKEKQKQMLSEQAEMKQMLSTLFKDHIAVIQAKDLQDKKNNAI